MKKFRLVGRSRAVAGWLLKTVELKIGTKNVFKVSYVVIQIEQIIKIRQCDILKLAFVR